VRIQGVNAVGRADNSPCIGHDDAVLRVLHHAVERPRQCSYLADETASLEYRLIVDVSPPEHEAMLERGWRRFGPSYFRPACAPCGQCVSLRLPVETFAPSRGQRRAARKGAALRRVVGPVRVDGERLALYAAWHAQREGARGWEPQPLGRNDYLRDFAFPHSCARELAYYDDHAPAGPRLVALGLCDETPRAWSAIYFFYDPAYAALSPGVLNVLDLVALARRGGQSHVYLGYRVAASASMRYKATFGPHELLAGRPGPAEAPRWLSASR
jgi:arginine-tRNA-protein transferase